MGVKGVYIQGGISTDSINEFTPAAGVGITGLEADTINEKTLGAGVTIQTPINGFGVNPLGTIIAIGNVAAWALPAADAVKDGYALCNGNTFAALVAGNYNAAFTGSRPTLNDSRFLMGSTAVGATGGQNSTTLGTANIPQMSGSFGSNSTGDHTHTYSGSVVNAGNHVHHLSDSIVQSYSFNQGSGTSYAPIQGTIASTDNWGNTSTNGDHGHSYSGTSAGSSIGNHSHTTTVTLGTASPTAIENRPLYFSVVYLMRVK